MFVLRCIFWLSIVYASMSWPHGAFNADDLGAHLRAQSAAAVRAAAAGPVIAAEICRSRAIACATDASRLTALLAGSPEKGDQLTAPARTARRRAADARVARAP